MSMSAISSSNDQNDSSGGSVVQGAGGSRPRVELTKRSMRKLAQKPREKLPSSFYTNPKAPLMFYGWAWDTDYLMGYATRHGLSYKLGDLELRYSDLAKPGFSKEDYPHYRLMFLQVPDVVKKHLQARCGFRLDMEFPASEERDGVFALYSNRNALLHAEVLYRQNNLERALGIIHTAMNEIGHQSDLLWWHCFNKYR